MFSIDVVPAFVFPIPVCIMEFYFISTSASEHVNIYACHTYITMSHTMRIIVNIDHLEPVGCTFNER